VLSGALNIVNLLGNALSFLAGPLKIIAGIYLAIKGIQLASLAISKGQALYESLKYGYAVGQRSMAMGYNGILIARQAILSGELAKSIAIAAAWAVANPLQAVAGILIAGTVAAGLYALASKTQFANGGIVTKEINNATVGEAGPEAIIPLNSPKADKLLGNSTSIDLTPMIAAINEVRSAVNNLVNRPIYLSIDGKNIGTALVQGSHKVA
jgi:hypothetical protein